MFSAIRQASRARTSLPLTAARPCRSVGFSIPSYRTLVTKKYTEEHEAVTFDDSTGVGIVSITDHAQESLGDVVFVDLPAVGSVVGKGEPIGAVESVKAASDIYAPVSGEILEVNQRLNEEPNLVNRSAEAEGWLCKIKLSEPSEMHDLLTLEGYVKSYES